ncbi:S-adenosyl-L-methionine-dependent methyltransferase [Xylariaceae sp. FL0804]|nr:S-adenosyl-L-methionine-dependent methyltransferase [Xylariaceae sp. FL0804]
MEDPYTDVMARGATEAQRLDAQFDLFTKSSLFRLQAEYPEATLDGYDISAALFPSSPPPGITLSVLDIKKPIPKHLHGLYDVVQLRMLVAAMERHEWRPVVQNVCQLLKPGGFLQWMECDFMGVKHFRGRADSSTETAAKVCKDFIAAFADRFKHGWNNLPDDMRTAGLTSVARDVVSSDRVPETRALVTANHARLGLEYIQRSVNTPGGLTSDQYEALEKRVSADIASGCYERFEMYVVYGQKPMRSNMSQ